jgi:hypothetical protein
MLLRPRTPLRCLPAVVLVTLGPVAAVAHGAVRRDRAAVVPSEIVLFRSIGVVSLGDAPDRVRDRLGPPEHTISLGGRVAQMQYGRLGLDIHFNTERPGDPVNFVSTGESRFRTPQGIHPGSPTAALTAAYHGLHQTGTTYSLYGRRGRSRTDFVTADGRVQSIDVAARPRGGSAVGAGRGGR